MASLIRNRTEEAAVKALGELYSSLAATGTLQTFKVEEMVDGATIVKPPPITFKGTKASLLTGKARTAFASILLSAGVLLAGVIGWLLVADFSDQDTANALTTNQWWLLFSVTAVVFFVFVLVVYGFSDFEFTIGDKDDVSDKPSDTDPDKPGDDKPADPDPPYPAEPKARLRFRRRRR